MRYNLAPLIAALDLVAAPCASAVAMAPQEATAEAAATAVDDALWTYSADEGITFQRLTALGSVAVATPGALLALDPTTGVPLWVRKDIAGLKEGGFESIPLTPYAVIRSKDGISVIDLQTGQTAWDATHVPLQKVRGYIPVVQHNLILVYGEDAGAPKLAGIALDNGEVRWAQDGLLSKKPETQEADGIHSLSGHQPPLLDTDSTMLLYLSKDGPMRIHVRTGERLWRADALQGKDVPLVSRWYAPLTLTDGMLLVPYEQKLMALDVQTGNRIWDREKKFKSPIAQIEVVPQGIVVRGARPLDQEDKPLGMPDAFIDLVDGKTGSSLWAKPFEKMADESIAPFVVSEDAVYFGDKETLYKIALADGSYLEHATYEFEGGEEPALLERREQEFLLLSEHNLVAVSERGAARHSYYPAPGSSLLSKVGKGLLFVASLASQAAAEDQLQRRGGVAVWFEYNPFIKQRLEQSADVGQYSYVYTRRPGNPEREGFGVAKIRRSDFTEVGRVWVQDRSADYLVDEVTGTVFLRRGEREIVALRFTSE